MGTAEVESALVAHPKVSEAAVVGYPHDIKGQGIYAYVTLNARRGAERGPAQGAGRLGAEGDRPDRLARPDPVGAGLPKTRSGKIMRRILRKIVGRAGIGPGERVAIVLPNGPEMAAAFLATAAHATAAPLNPAYRVDEFAFYLEDLRARALILQAGAETPAIAAAERVGVPIIGLAPEPGAGAGSFTLDVPAGAGDAQADGERDDAALVLHTSGTTSRPKIVPLTAANLCASARNIADWIALEPGERCLNIMPLFHIHGLMAGVMASLHAGSTVICTPGFNALRVFAWLDEMAPTWLTAVPTMHQAILAARRAQQGDRRPPQAPPACARPPRRCLPPVMEELEATFDAPVIESYGMTEASHQMASNPMPPAERRPGGVGDRRRAARSPIMDEAGRLQAPGAQGEVVIRGPNVTHGYENNPEANADGVRGRLVPHRRPGRDRRGRLSDAHRAAQGDHQPRRREDLAPRGGRGADGRTPPWRRSSPSPCRTKSSAKTWRRRSCCARAPRRASGRAARLRRATRSPTSRCRARILFRDEIPKGATGKLQRIGLAEKLGIAP